MAWPWNLVQKKFTESTGYFIDDVGLVISKEPFLACSPDGIIFDGDSYELLEVKCPYSCEGSIIVNFKKRESKVNYLVFDKKGVLHLKKNHKYNTQIQVSMYILNVRVCNFFVYSSEDFVRLKIAPLLFRTFRNNDL